MTFYSVFGAAAWIAVFLLMLALLLDFLESGYSQLLTGPVVILTVFSLFMAMYQSSGEDKDGSPAQDSVYHAVKRRVRRPTSRTQRMARRTRR